MINRLALSTTVSVVLATAAPAVTPPAGTVTFGTERYVEHIAGSLPIVISSPHGGSLRPATIADRTAGVTASDLNSQDLARALADALHQASGLRPHVVASHLHRRKLDPNREIKEAAAGNAIAERAWREYHDFVRTSTGAAVQQHGFAFLVDIHGHAHPLPRLELGYSLGSVQLNQDDRAFEQSDFTRLSSLRDLHARVGGSGVDLIRGPRSLGALFVARGIRAVPSPAEPGPGPGPFFSGGYTVSTHASAADTKHVDGVQFEAFRTGLRDTEKNRARFASIAAEVLLIFLRERYGFDPAGTPPRK